MNVPPADNHQTEALVLNCIDHRLVDDVTRYMAERSMQDKYDQISLAGASIGVLTDEKSSWSQTFWDHVELARKFHGIRKIIAIDHRDCAACKAFVTPTCGEDKEAELKLHTVMLNQLAREIRMREPGLDVELLLMDLDGSVQPIPATGCAGASSIQTSSS
ncbi:MAG: carbonic anhydrase [Rhizobiaceae bacterium]